MRVTLSCGNGARSGSLMNPRRVFGQRGSRSCGRRESRNRASSASLTRFAKRYGIELGRARPDIPAREPRQPLRTLIMSREMGSNASTWPSDRRGLGASRPQTGIGGANSCRSLRDISEIEGPRSKGFVSLNIRDTGLARIQTTMNGHIAELSVRGPICSLRLTARSPEISAEATPSRPGIKNAARATIGPASNARRRQ
jgi:hypothetical protein